MAKKNKQQAPRIMMMSAPIFKEESEVREGLTFTVTKDELGGYNWSDGETTIAITVDNTVTVVASSELLTYTLATTDEVSFLAEKTEGYTLTGITPSLFDALEAKWEAATVTTPAPEPVGDEEPGADTVTPPESVELIGTVTTTFLVEQLPVDPIGACKYTLTVVGDKALFDKLNGVLTTPDADDAPSRIEVDKTYGITLNFDWATLDTLRVVGNISIQGQLFEDVKLSDVPGGPGVVFTNVALAEELYLQAELGGVIGFDFDLRSEVDAPVGVLPTLVLSERPDCFNHDSRAVQPMLSLMWDYIYHASPDSGATYDEIGDKLAMFVAQINKMLELDSELFSAVYNKFEDAYCEFGDDLLLPKNVGRGITKIRNLVLRKRLFALLDILNIVTTTEDKGKLPLLIDFDDLERLGFSNVQAANLRAYYEM